MRTIVILDFFSVLKPREFFNSIKKQQTHFFSFITILITNEMF